MEYMANADHRKTTIIPWRYALFLALMLLIPLSAMRFPLGLSVMAGFDFAALGFVATLPSLFGHDPHKMRSRAVANDPSRVWILLITGLVSAVILATVVIELRIKDALTPIMIVMLIGTLALSWLFSNLVYALHYAHLYYGSVDGADRGGIDFPGKALPDYWDFTYFACTLGMTFQTSDVQISDAGIRKTALFHSLAAFVFNLGVIAFSINILGSM
jgi:uncharacterized membrane protein